MNTPHTSNDIIGERYQVLSLLGQGSMGSTYAAEDRANGERVAIKVLSLRQMGKWKILELFEREARVLQNLNHPNIPRYLDFFYIDISEDRHFYLVHELFLGESLAQ